MAQPMSHFTILLGGELARTPRLMRQIEGSRVIAADSGIRHATTLEVVPELWVGDFDSSDANMIEGHADIERMVFPPEKDMTDGEIAVDEAVSRGATSLLLAGAFGGPRADHAFLHLSFAVRMFERGTPALLSSGAQEGSALPHGVSEYDYPPGTMFSILGFSELCGLTVTGAQWPLDDVVVPLGSSLTLSNVVESSLAVTLREGRALLLAHFNAT